MATTKVDCRNCGGDGFRLEGGDCPACNGTGWEQLHVIECLDGPDGCAGNVAPRMPLSGTGQSFARCDHHWDERLAKHEQDQERYPDSPCAPSWFDEADAGERWDED